MTRWLVRAADGLAVFAGIVLVLMTLSVGVDVLTRNAFRYPIVGVFDFVESGQVLVVFAGLPKVFLEGANITVDLIDRVSSARWIARLKSAAGILAAAFMVILLVAVSDPALHAWSSGEIKPELRLPVYVLWGVVLLGVAASGITALRYAWRVIATGRGDGGH